MPRNDTPLPLARDAATARMNKQAQDIQALKERVGRLERGAPIPASTTSPVGSPARDGTFHVQTPISRLWLRVNGQWAYTDLTVVLP